MKFGFACISFVIFFTGIGTHAENYPNKPIRMIVPKTPGGTSDIFGRVLAQKLSESLGQPIVIDNRAGASGVIGTDLVAKSRPDGYTIIMADTTLTTASSIYGKLPYDPISDFAPISMVATTPLLLTVLPQLPVHTVKEFIALAKSRPGQLNFSSAGNGTGSHLGGELFKTMAGIDIMHIPYKGSGLAMTDLIGGQVQAMFAGMVVVKPHIESGRVRGIAVTSAKRSSALPQFPTVAETGLPGFDVSTWYGVLAPAHMPKVITERLNSEILKALQDRELRQRIANEGADMVGSPPAEFAVFLKADVARWKRVITKSGAKLD